MNEEDKSLWDEAWLMTLRAGILKTKDEYNTYAFALYRSMIWAKEHTIEVAEEEKPVFRYLATISKNNAINK